MSDETSRLKLAQLVSMQELNAVTWNEALAQIDAFADLCLKGQFVNTPPTSPADGDAYLIGGAPTDAWSGYVYKIASCLDGAWRFYTPFNGLRAYVEPTGAFIVYLNGTWTDWNSLISASETCIASAAICDLDAAGSLFVQITGTATIASFGTAANKLRFVRFTGALALTHNASSLILLGGASRTTAAGDVGVYASDGSGNWRERAYFRAAADPGDYATRSGTETLSNKTFSGPLNVDGQIRADGSGGAYAYFDPDGTYMVDMFGSGRRFRVGDGTNMFIIGQWDGVNNRVEASGRPLFIASYGGAVTIGYGGGSDLTIGTDHNTTVLGLTANALRIAASSPPASASAAGAAGQIAWDADYLYLCTAADTWKRAALSGW